MKPSISSPGLSLDAAILHWTRSQAFRAPPKMSRSTRAITVAISRECGSGGKAIADLLGEKLGWPVYDQELVNYIADNAGIRSDLAASLDERRPNWLAECLEACTLGSHLSGAGYAVHLQKVLAALSCHGDCVILGRGAAQVLPRNCTVRVRLWAPLSHRIERASRERGLEGDVARTLETIDKERTNFVKRYFHKNSDDPRGYDLILDTACFTDDACAEIIAAAVEGRRARETS
ncbi:MAG: cytidylate kinase-like family protein [Planctomycetales bacterium]|nr:cytidylate kinase-like family protein [Planctomycetales bacterium]